MMTKQDFQKQMIYADLALVVSCKELDKNMLNRFKEKMSEIPSDLSGSKAVKELISISKKETGSRLGEEFGYLKNRYSPHLSFYTAYAVTAIISQEFKEMPIENAFYKIFDEKISVLPKEAYQKYHLSGWFRLMTPDNAEVRPARLLLPYYFLQQIGFSVSDKDSKLVKTIKTYEKWLAEFKVLTEREFKDSIYKMEFKYEN